MTGIARAGVDSAGGVIQGGGQFIARIDGAPIVVLNDPVISHGSGPHQGARMVMGSGIMRINSKPVVLAGMPASCGDQATGSPTVKCSG